MKKIIFLPAVLFGTLLFAAGANAAYIESVSWDAASDTVTITYNY